MDAWLVTWDGASAHEYEDRSIVAVLNPSMTIREVSAIVEALYLQATATIEEMAAYAGEESDNPYRAEVSINSVGYESLICGHNPYLEAHLVKELTIRTDEEANEETVSWKLQVHSGDWISKSAVQKMKDS